MKIAASRYHDFSYGHRVCGHTGKCRFLHGHNGRVTFFCEAEQLNDIGMVIDFSVIKSTLCNWIEDNWDHKFLLHYKDPHVNTIKSLDETVVETDFNPTAENMADWLLNRVGPEVLQGTGVVLTKVIFEETRKCAVEVTL